MSKLHTYPPEELTPDQRRALFDLFWHIWPGKEPYEVAKTKFDPLGQQKWEASLDYHRFMIWDGDKAVAQAGFFARQIITTEGPILIGALSGVCTHEDYRKRGYGQKIVQAAFGLVDEGIFPVALFMTAVEPFYERLGARVVKNEWINTRNLAQPNEDPWPEEEKMIYPANYPWPEGQIDLNGPAY